MNLARDGFDMAHYIMMYKVDKNFYWPVSHRCSAMCFCQMSKILISCGSFIGAHSSLYYTVLQKSDRIDYKTN